jgi:hypothetical protein
MIPTFECPNSAGVQAVPLATIVPSELLSHSVKREVLLEITFLRKLGITIVSHLHEIFPIPPRKSRHPGQSYVQPHPFSKGSGRRWPDRGWRQGVGTPLSPPRPSKRTRLEDEASMAVNARAS